LGLGLHLLSILSRFPNLDSEWLNRDLGLVDSDLDHEVLQNTVHF